MLIVVRMSILDPRLPFGCQTLTRTVVFVSTSSCNVHVCVLWLRWSYVCIGYAVDGVAVEVVRVLCSLHQQTLVPVRALASSGLKSNQS